MPWMLRIAALLSLAALFGCSNDPSLCPDTWGEAAQIPGGGGRCAPPEHVTQAARARLTTGIYGYVTKGENSGCEPCETELARYATFVLGWVSPDGDSELLMEIESGDAPTFEAELPAGRYASDNWLLTAGKRVPSDESGHQSFVLEEGEVLFFAVDLGCERGC
jgi:hypothetical protein